MQKYPLVSVVIPVYNMEGYLEETVHSVLASDYPNIEVVIMDDGSTDASYTIALNLQQKDTRIKTYHQENKGVSAARNHAISVASGEFILPVDSDNLISSSFISNSIKVLLQDPEIKVVAPRADFFGDKEGEWKLPSFSLSLLAHKNIMDTCALYKKSEWQRIGGYNEEIIAREDWAFWIAMLKNGGKVFRLPEISLHYRIRNSSKRISDRALKKHVIDVLNKCHPDFFYRELGGPLRYQRTYSKLINFFSRLISPFKYSVNSAYKDFASTIIRLPETFGTTGECIYKGRNELKLQKFGENEVIVKSYKRPHLINRLVYAYFRKSKAERAYDYARMFREHGIGSPEPIGFVTKGRYGLFDKSYFVCLKSECPYTYRDLTKRSFSRQNEILQAIGRTTALMHEAGYYHEDYSGGNILFRDDQPEIQVEIIDLNRLSFLKIDMNKGCKNFYRLRGTEAMLQIMAEAYAEVRGFDSKECTRLIQEYINKDADKHH